MKLSFLFALLFLLQAGNGIAQSAKQIRTVETPLVVKGKWIKSSYDYNTETGDYYFVEDGKRMSFDDYFAKSKDYLKNTIWVDMTTITYAGKKYEKYALPRVLGLDDVSPVGKYKDLLVMAEAGEKSAAPGVIWLPHSASMGTASFQAYQLKK
ncbi:MAG TPA: hypothetical protein VMR70_20825 [Flavisolibacter sp.]|nr:hypothetical protein [Flavisolibacter sp.]